jgi:hypothetical protein
MIDMIDDRQVDDRHGAHLLHPPSWTQQEYVSYPWVPEALGKTPGLPSYHPHACTSWVSQHMGLYQS